MIYRKLVAPFAGLALIASAAFSAPAAAQAFEDGDDTLLWMIGGTVAVVALIVAIGVSDEDEDQPVSP